MTKEKKKEEKVAPEKEAAEEKAAEEKGAAKEKATGEKAGAEAKEAELLPKLVESQEPTWRNVVTILDDLKYLEQPLLNHTITDLFLTIDSKSYLDKSYLGDYVSNIGSLSRSVNLQSEIARLRAEVDEKASTLLNQRSDARQKEQQINELKQAVENLKEKQNLSHLLSRVGEPAQKKLLTSPDFRTLFDSDEARTAYVLSIDIRRSTELMLKARDPRLYARFIIDLAAQLRGVILEHFGVFDKFTGDGILAFFPDFYSGKDAGYFALKAASTCHERFNSHYEKNKRCFISILKDIGLGIGLDYGLVQVVQVGGDLTVVGTPVVYACRMGGAESGQTYVNQPAFEQLFDNYSAYCDFEECEINIKHEGKTLAYNAVLNGKQYTPSPPDWLSSNGSGGATSSADAKTQGES